MWWLTVLLTCTYVRLSSAELPLPPYIRPCARTDPKFNECALQRGREAIPHVIKGDRKYKIPTLDPLEIEKVTVANGGPRGLNMILKNVKMYGVKDINVEQTEFDFEKRHIHYEVSLPKVTVVGKYEVSGRILLLPITGNGDINMTFDNVHVVFDHGYSLVMVDGKRHMHPDDPSSTVTTSRMHIHQSNLFNGDKALGDQMDQFLNENWREVFNEMEPTVTSVFNEIFISIATALDSVVPYDVAFPETIP